VKKPWRHYPWYSDAHIAEHSGYRTIAPEEVERAVLLIGDTGAPETGQPDLVLHMMAEHLHELKERITAVLLGDVVYPNGLPKETSFLRKKAEKRLQAQIDVVKDHTGAVYVLPGNHDWNMGRKNGFEYAERLEKYLQGHSGRPDIYQPQHNCPDPVEIPVTNDLTMIILNSQWWAQPGPKPVGEKDGCQSRSGKDAIAKLKEILNRTEGQYRLIATHHPLFTNGQHGGRFPFKRHIFPLTDAHKRLYIPLPLVGSLYPYYRKYIGAREDMIDKTYKQFREQLLRLFSAHRKLLYAAGHDHSLQYFRKNNHHYIVSGSGSRTSYVEGGHGAHFTHAERGFFKLSQLKNGEFWLEAWESAKDEQSAYGRLMFQTRITAEPDDKARTLDKMG